MLNHYAKFDANQSIVKFVYTGTERSEQTVQTQIRLLLKEQSDQGLHSLPIFLQHSIGTPRPVT